MSAAPKGTQSGDNMPGLSNMLAEAYKATDRNAIAPAPTPKPDAAKPDAPAADAPKPAEAKRTSVFDKKPADAPKPDDKPPAQEFPEDKWVLPENAGPEARKNRDQVIATVKAQRAELEAAKKQLETYKTAAPVDTENFTKLQTEHKKVLDRLAILDLQSHPDHLKTFVEPRQKALAEAKEALSWHGKDGADLDGILGKQPKEFSAALSDMIKDLPEAEKMTVFNSMRSAYKLAADEKGLLSKAGEVQQQLRAKAVAQQKQAFDETWNKLGPVGDFLTTLDAPDNATPEQRAEVESYNAAVQSVRDTAQKYAFNPSDEKGVALMASKAATMDFLLQQAMPRMEREYREAVTTIQALTKEIQALKGSSSPGPVAGDKGAATPGKQSIDDMVGAAFRRR